MFENTKLQLSQIIRHYTSDTAVLREKITKMEKEILYAKITIEENERALTYVKQIQETLEAELSIV